MHLQQAGNSLSSSIGDTDLLLASSCDIFSEVLDVTDGTLQFLHQQYHTIHHVRVATDLSRVIGRQINHLMSALDISTGPVHFSDRRTSSGQYISSFTSPYGPPRYMSGQQISNSAGPNDDKSQYRVCTFRGGPRPTSRQFLRSHFATARRHRRASRACQSSTLTSVFRSRRTRYFNANIRDASGHFSPRSTCVGFRVNSFEFNHICEAISSRLV